MSKTVNYGPQANVSKDVGELRARLINRYMEKFRIIWMSSYEWKGISLAASQYIMRKLWETGNIAAFAYDAPYLEKKVIDYLPWAQYDYNSHHDPSRIMIINESNAKNVPSEKLEVVYDELQIKNDNPKAVICYAQSNRESIRAVARDYVDLIIRVEMTINTALVAAKQPFLITFDPDRKDQSADFQKRLMNDDPIFYTSGTVLANASTSPNFIIDKLYQFKVQRENEFLTYLGIDNAPIQKKERETMDEANSNNDLINDHEASINENLREFADLTNKTFGTSISITPRHAPSASVHESIKEEADDGNNQ